MRNIATERRGRVNHTLNERETKTREPSAFNLHQLLCEHLLVMLNEYETQALEQICQLTRAGKQWRTYVNDHLR